MSKSANEAATEPKGILRRRLQKIFFRAFGAIARATISEFIGAARPNHITPP
jgi:hypothetical protein